MNSGLSRIRVLEINKDQHNSAKGSRATKFTKLARFAKVTQPKSAPASSSRCFIGLRVVWPLLR